MAFKDSVSYLVIKIWIKSELPKITLQPKMGLVKIKTQMAQLPPNIEPKNRPKILPE